jgi:hypothetical protein
MKKQGFFDELKRELKNVELQTAETIIKAMHEHYDYALQSGKTEAEVCEKLGDPKDIAEEVAEQERLLITNDKSAVNLQNIDTDGYTIFLGANNIKMNFTNMDMEIGTSPSEIIQFIGISEEEVERCFTIAVTRDALTIKDRYKFNLISYIRHKRQQAKLLLPQGFCHKINLSLINSNITAKDLQCKRMSINATANLINIKGITCDSFKLRCTALGININKSALGDCNIFCTASTLSFTDVDCSKLDIKDTASTVEFIGGTSEALFKNR